MIGREEMQVRVTADTGNVQSGMVVAARSVRFGADEMRQAFARLDGQLGDIRATVAQAQTSIAGVGTRMGVTAGAVGAGAFVMVQAFGQVAQAIGQSISRQIDLGDQVDRLRTKTGMTAEAVTGLEYAARLADVPFAALAQSLRIMQTNLAEAANGSKEATGTLRDLQITLEEIRGLQADAQFELIAQRISEIRDPAERTRLVVAMFGRAGADLLPMFEQGAAGIRSAREEAERLGLTLSEEGLRALADADLAAKKLDASLEGLSRTLTVKLAPALSGLADNLRLALGGGSPLEYLDRDIRNLQQQLEREAPGTGLAQQLERKLAEAQNRRNALTRDKDVSAFDRQSEEIRRRAFGLEAPMPELPAGAIPDVKRAGGAKSGKPAEDAIASIEQFNRIAEQRVARDLEESMRRSMQAIDRDISAAMASAQEQFANLQQYNAEAAEESARAWEQALEPINRAFDKAFTGVIMGTQSMRQAVNGIMQSIALEFASSAARMATKWIGEQVRIILTQRTLAKGNVMANAAEAGSGAYKAMVGIPIVGPVLAPAAAAVAFAGTLAFGAKIPSARGGFDIPSGSNPLTQLHEREMVLPAKYADVVRTMADGGGRDDDPTPVVLQTQPVGRGLHLVTEDNLLEMLQRLQRRQGYA